MDISTVDVTPAVSSAPAADSITYLALGDSYTIGEAVKPAQSFPYQLVAQLKGNGLPTVASPVIIARTGWRTDDLLAAVKEAHLNRKFDYVTLLIGVNNQFQQGSSATYRSQFIQLLDTAITYTKGNVKRVFVLSIPDYSVTPFAAGMDQAAISQQIDLFNAINLEEAQKAGVTYINITDISRQAATNTSLIAADGLHPSGLMYDAWVQRLLDPVKTSLK